MSASDASAQDLFGRSVVHAALLGGHGCDMDFLRTEFGPASGEPDIF